MGSMSTFLRTPFSKNGLKCTNFYEGILTKYIHNSKNHHYWLQQLQLNKTFIYNRRHLLSLIRYLSYTLLSILWSFNSQIQIPFLPLNLSFLYKASNVLYFHALLFHYFSIPFPNKPIFVSFEFVTEISSNSVNGWVNWLICLISLWSQ